MMMLASVAHCWSSNALVHQMGHPAEIIVCTGCKARTEARCQDSGCCVVILELDEGSECRVDDEQNNACSNDSMP